VKSKVGYGISLPMHSKHNRQTYGWIGLIFSAFLATSALAGWEEIKSKEFDVSPPPSEGSAAYKKDYQILHDYQDTRDRETCELARQMGYPSYKTFYSDVLTKKEYTNAKDLMERVLAYGVRVGSHFKKEYERPRPYDVDKTLKPCAPKPGGSKAYPSGHATAATLSSCILAEIYPAKAKKIHEFGAYMGDIRVVVGLHHPSDVAAGQKLGNDICERLLTEEDFLQEMESLSR
jgi:acid phosphatase (class A)